MKAVVVHASRGAGRIDAARLERVLPADVGERTVPVFGPPEMTAVARAALRALGVPRGRLQVEDVALG